MRHVIFTTNQEPQTWLSVGRAVSGSTEGGSELPTGGHLQREDPSQDASQLWTPVLSEHPNHALQVVCETDDCAPQTRHLFIFMYLALLRLKWVSWSVCVPTQPSG